MRKRKLSKAATPTTLPVVQPNVAGIDIGSTKHWVCGPPRPDGVPNVREFGTTTSELEELVAWLVEQKVASVAMESTSVYWIPLYELLETQGIEVKLVNARQLHNVPSRKTDVSDCQWLQLLHSCGLLRGSFRPGESIIRMRALQRHASNLTHQRTKFVQWMQKALDQMNVQVHRAVADITGETGMAIIRDIVQGVREPVRLAAHRNFRCKKSVEQIGEHLRGNWREEHLFTLKSALTLYDANEQEFASCQAQLLEYAKSLVPPERQDAPVPAHPNLTKAKAIQHRGDAEARALMWRFAGKDLTLIDGINTTVAQVVLTEVGANLSAFPTEHHFVSWLRLCPRMAISGGKSLAPKRNGLGANRVAAALRMAAVTLRNTKSALGAAYRRLARLKGASVAVFATARQLAKLVYRMLRHGEDYVDIGQQAYEHRFETQRLLGLTRAAESLGYSLVRPPSPAPAAT